MIPRQDDTPFDTFGKQAKKYGNIVGLFLGMQPTILISGIEDVKEISTKEEFSFRPNISLPLYKMFAYKKLGNSFFRKKSILNYLPGCEVSKIH
jgi:Cytochrome P450